LAVSLLRPQLRLLAGQLEGHDIELGARIDPDPLAVRHCAEAGLGGVEINTAAYALAARPSSRTRRLAELAETLQQAETLGLQTSVRGGLDFSNIPALIGCGPIAELRIGQALVAQALFDGIAASIARMRDLLGGRIE
jgi:pyridoxine 5-phosphate synthase